MKTKNIKNKKFFLDSSRIEENATYLARWIALYEAINMIADEALSRKKEFNKLKLSPVKIKKYISSVEDQIQKKILEDNLKSNIINNNCISKNSYTI